MILTEQHENPPKLVRTNAATVASSALIKQGNVQRMADLGLYRHESLGEPPYGDWELVQDDQGPLYRRQARSLTPQERAAELQERWEQQAAATRYRSARALLSAPPPPHPTAQDIERRIQALRTLQEQL